MDPKTIWMFKKEIASVLIDHDAVIFGGFVRDMVLHDAHATMFYEKNKDASSEQYNDPLFHPETIDRCVIPRDIDCCISKQQLERTISELQSKQLNVQKIFERDPSEYMLDQYIPKNSIRHVRLNISIFGFNKAHEMKKKILSSLSSYKDHQIKKYVNDFIDGLHPICKDKQISVDVDAFFYLDESHVLKSPPLTQYDFLCNTLLYSKQGIHLDSIFDTHNAWKNNRQLNIILKQIQNKIAETCSDGVSQLRIEKMNNYGWHISGKSLKCVHDPSYLGICIICHDKVPEYHYKLPCCNARYHLKCLEDTCTKGHNSISLTQKCIVCKRQAAIENDMQLFNF